MDSSKKRNLSELSDTSIPSPAANPSKALKMNANPTLSEDTGDDTSMISTQNSSESISNSKSLEQKIDEILHLLKAQKVEVSIDISALQNENRQLKLHQQESDGIIARLSSRIASMEKS